MDVESAATEGRCHTLPRTTRSLNVTVLMGGPSAERAVSILSGDAVADALESLGHRVRRADVGPTNCAALDAADVEVAFIALHGDFGESGQVQQLCQQRGLPYIGSDARASQLAIQKAAAKQAFRRAGLDTPDWMVIEEFHRPAPVSRWLAELPPPVVLKPVDGGSSLDITIARDHATRDRALERLLDRYSRAMVERYVEGRELTVGILGSDVLPVLEIVPPGEFYDYEAKYSDCGTQYLFDHDLDQAAQQELSDAAWRAHQALGCRDLSRVDFILDGDGRAQVLEINTIPGFTSHSLLPMAAARVGVSFERMADALLAMAMRRHRLAPEG